ncbi:MAG: YebC/PmpR family DNA-binding transcriptional regulator [Thermodesulfobacteriota bacterium]
MSGHSKWASIKHKKAAVDAKRGKIFTKIIKEIMVAARLGGGDPDGNARLRLAVEKAKSVNMPKENIERAIKKGTGELGGTAYEEFLYEGYGPGGVAVLVEVMTDNRNRAVGEIRHLFTKHNGKPGEAGSVAWMFEKKGLILVDKTDCDEELLMETALEAGAEDVQDEDEAWAVHTWPADFEVVKRAISNRGWRVLSAELTMVPKSTLRIEGKEAEQMLRLMMALEDNDDVQNAYANFDIPKEIMGQLAG